MQWRIPARADLDLVPSEPAVYHPLRGELMVERPESNKGALPLIQAEYIPSGAGQTGAARPPTRSRSIWAYLLVAPVVGGIVAGAIALDRGRPFGGMGHIEVSVNPPDARVWLDGKLVAGRSPASLAVPTGVHNLTLSRDGFVPIAQKVDVAADQIVAVSVALVAAPPAPRPPAPQVHHRPKLPPKLDGVVYVDMGTPASDRPAPAGASASSSGGAAPP
jgi:hypothetical protein